MVVLHECDRFSNGLFKCALVEAFIEEATFVAKDGGGEYFDFRDGGVNDVHMDEDSNILFGQWVMKRMRSGCFLMREGGVFLA